MTTRQKIRSAVDVGMTVLLLLLPGCGAANDTQPQLPEESMTTMKEAFTRTSSISPVIHDPAFGSYGRLLFPTDKYYYSGDTLEELEVDTDCCSLWGGSAGGHRHRISCVPRLRPWLRLGNGNLCRGLAG